MFPLSPFPNTDCSHWPLHSEGENEGKRRAGEESRETLQPPQTCPFLEKEIESTKMVAVKFGINRKYIGKSNKRLCFDKVLQ